MCFCQEDLGARAVADPGGGGGGRGRPPRAGQKKKKEEEEKEKKSALGFVKSDHRSMMSEGRLNALLRLYVHKDIHLDFEEVVTAYGHKHPRRMLTTEFFVFQQSFY